MIAALAVATMAAMQSAPTVPPGAPAGATPPTLVGTDNAVTDAIAALRGEIEALGREPASAARDARIALRRMAFDLLFHGTDDLDAQGGPVAGLRLSALRGEVDARLSAPLRTGLAAVAVESPLVRFAAAAAAIVPGPATDAPAPAVADALGHLVGAIALMEGDAQRTEPWPAASTLDAAAGRAAGSPARGAGDAREAPPDLDAARARIAAFDPQSLRPDARALAADLVRAAARAPGDAEVVAIDADLRRLRQLTSWVDSAAAAKASLRSRFDATTRAWVKSLHEPTRRAQARASMARFESERSAIDAFPLEAELRRGDPSAVGKAAGRAKDVLAAIDRLRAAWQEGWLDGRGDPARTAAAMRLVRALAAVDAAVPVGMSGPAAGEAAAEAPAPAAWGGWPWIADAPAVPAKGLAARAELALAALLDGDDAAADRQLATLDLELPIATLDRTLRERLAPWSRGRSGLAHRLAAAVAAPGPEAWLGARRADLCAVARLLAESARARARDEAPRVDALRREIARRAAPIASPP